MNRILIICLFLFPTFLFAQRDFEVGLLLGASGYNGDLDPDTDKIATGKKHPALGLFTRVDLNRFLSTKANLTFGKISGNDANSNNASRVRRNLSFQSRIIEFGLTAEINPLGTNGQDKRFTPYLFGGIALFNFKPETNFQGRLVELQPLGTEGQGMDGFGEKYKLTQLAIPVGIGAKYRITERINLGFELSIRKTFTDYLDDVSGSYVNFNELAAGNGDLAAALGNRSAELTGTEPAQVLTGTQRGNPNAKDIYYTAGITVSYQFFGKSNGLSRRGKNQIGCPMN